MVIGIVGCATNKMIVFSQPIDEPIEVSSKPVGKIQNFLIVDSYNNLSSSYQNGTTRQIGSSLKAEAMNISSGAKWHVGNFQGMNIRSWVRVQCEVETDGTCLLSRYLDEVYYLDLEDYKTKKAEEELKFQEYAKQKKAEREALKEQRKQWAEEKRESRFVELECKLGKNLDEESKPIKIKIEINKSKSDEYSGNVWYPKYLAPPFHRGYISGNTVRYKFESISVNDREITGGVDMNFASFYVLTINRYSGSIEADGGGDYWSRAGECIAIEEQKF
jgi:hypothetical protein